MKRVKYILQSLIFCLFSFYACAQNAASTETHTITLKDGSVFEGVIKEYIEGEKLILQLSTNISKTIKDKHIQKIVTSNNVVPTTNKSETKNISNNGFNYNKKLYFEANYAMLMAKSAYATNAGLEDKVNEIDRGMGMQLIGGYQLNRWIGAGLGIGADYYYLNSGETILPVFADVRGHLTKNIVSLIYKAQAGYGFALKDDEQNMVRAAGGIMLYPALGLHFSTKSNVNFTLDFGYKFQKAKYEYNVTDVPTWWNMANVRVENDLEYNRFAVRAGVIF